MAQTKKSTGATKTCKRCVTIREPITGTFVAEYLPGDRIPKEHVEMISESLHPKVLMQDADYEEHGDPNPDPDTIMSETSEQKDYAAWSKLKVGELKRHVSTNKLPMTGTPSKSNLIQTLIGHGIVVPD